MHVPEETHILDWDRIKNLQSPLSGQMLSTVARSAQGQAALPIESLHSSVFVFFLTTPLANSPNVIPASESTISSKFGWVKTASVFLATLCPSVPAAPRTKCGTARNRPLVISSSASPVWNASELRGMLTLTVSLWRERM